MHSTMQYFCCYTQAQYRNISQVLSQLRWKRAENIRFSQIVCKQGGDGIASAYSIVVYADRASQVTLMGLVDQFQTALMDAGIPIHIPREQQEKFHTTLAVVAQDFPLAEALQDLKQNTNFSSVAVAIDYLLMEFPPKLLMSSLFQPTL